jgi:hypothetical protein
MKSTIEGIVGALIAVFTAILAFQVPSALLTPQATHIWLWVTTGITLALAIARAVLGFLQNDAPPPAPSVKP